MTEARQYDKLATELHLRRQDYCSFTHLSCDMKFPTKRDVQPAKAQTSLRIRAVWSEPLLVTWIFYEC